MTSAGRFGRVAGAGARAAQDGGRVGGFPTVNERGCVGSADGAKERRNTRPRTAAPRPPSRRGAAERSEGGRFRIRHTRRREKGRRRGAGSGAWGGGPPQKAAPRRRLCRGRPYPRPQRRPWRRRRPPRAHAPRRCPLHLERHEGREPRGGGRFAPAGERGRVREFPTVNCAAHIGRALRETRGPGGAALCSLRAPPAQLRANWPHLRAPRGSGRAAAVPFWPRGGARWGRSAAGPVRAAARLRIAAAGGRAGRAAGPLAGGGGLSPSPPIAASLAARRGAARRTCCLL